MRIASFNAENLFERARVFNFEDHNIGDDILAQIGQLQDLLAEKNYTPLRKKKMLDLYLEELKDYIEVREDRGKLFKRKGPAVVGIQADGKDEWDGAIEFKTADFSDVERGNTAQVIKDVKADVLCMVEVESRPVLHAFDAHLLGSRYRYEMLIDGNDPRGIDVGLYSKYPIVGIATHMFDKVGSTTIFSRDCLEVELVTPSGHSLFMLINHFKSRGYDYEGTADAKRKRQATRVAEILKEKYKLTQDWVVVAGDFNDSPTSAPLQPLLTLNNLYDVLKLQLPKDPARRWTYHYDAFEQIDFLLVSRPLRDRFAQAGVARGGIYDLEALTTAAGGTIDVEKQYDTVTNWRSSASDHGAVWAEFN